MEKQLSGRSQSAIYWGSLVGILAVLIGYWGHNRKAATTDPPNIILIVADDLGMTDLGVYGNSVIETPRMDALAAAGILFTEAYAAAPICSPSRAAIQTGLHPARIGMTEHLRGIPPVDPCQPIIPPKNVGRLALAYTTIAEVLDSAGYHTAYVGKWHLGHGAAYRPTGHGFDISYAAGGQGLPNSFFPPYFNGNPYPELHTIAGQDTFLSDALTTLAIETLPGDATTPFFLNLNYYAPHVPIMAPADLVAKYEGILGTDPDVLPRPHYAAMVEAIDRQIGRLVDTLTARGLMENTILMITSDHGPLTVEEVVPFDQHTPPTLAGNLRGGKGMIFEGGLRVPLIAYAPGRYAPAVSAEVNTNLDYFSTITALAGVPRTTPDGQRIATLTGEDPTGPRQLYWHFPHYSPQRGLPAAAIRSGDQKLIEWYSDVDSLYFFHLGLDPGEQNNRIDSDLEAAFLLRDSLADWRRWVGARMPEPNPAYVAEDCD